MKNNLLLSIIIPCYNGEKYLNNSLRSIINNQTIESNLIDLFEVIIINDGSKDQSLALSKKLQKEFNLYKKNLVKVVNKENGQYGSVINAGIQKAKGLYFKVLDVDDSFKTEIFIKYLYTLKSLKYQVDTIFTDYNMEVINKNKIFHKKISHTITSNKIILIKNMVFPNDIITMHSITYRTNLLKEINYHQIENIYYTDSQYSLIPLIKSKSFYYIKLPLYLYYIGRNEQSININNMIKNKQHQNTVLFSLLKDIDFDQIENKHLARYAMIAIRRLIQWNLLLIFKDKSIKNKRKAVLMKIKKIKKYQPKYYQKILKGSLFVTLKITRGHFVVPIFKVGLALYTIIFKNSALI